MRTICVFCSRVYSRWTSRLKFGMGSIRGSVISSVILTVLPELLRSMSDYRMLAYSVVLIMMMLSKHSETVQAALEKVKGMFGRGRKEEVHS